MLRIVIEKVRVIRLQIIDKLKIRDFSAFNMFWPTKSRTDSHVRWFK